MSSEIEFYLPSKIGAYLRRLDLEYETTNFEGLQSILHGSRYFVRVGTFYDNWDGGTHGHDVIFFVNPSVLKGIKLDRQSEIEQKICDDLNECARSLSGEQVNTVGIEIVDEGDPEYQRSVPFAATQRTRVRTQLGPP